MFQLYLLNQSRQRHNISSQGIFFPQFPILLVFPFVPLPTLPKKEKRKQNIQKTKHFILGKIIKCNVHEQGGLELENSTNSILDAVEFYIHSLYTVKSVPI